MFYNILAGHQPRMAGAFCADTGVQGKHCNISVLGSLAEMTRGIKMLAAICDDDKEITEEVLLYCKECLGNGCGIVTFNDGKKLLEYSGDIDLLVLDIEMPGGNGIEIKDKFQRADKRTLIIFLTNYREFVMDAFGINVLGFIVKDNLKVQLPVMLETACHILEKYVMIDGLFNSRDVLYIKSEHNYGKLILSNGGTHMVRASMKQLEEELAKYNFLRIHRGYIVNMDWIEEFSEENVQMPGEKLPIAIRLRGKVKREYREYRKKNDGLQEAYLIISSSVLVLFILFVSKFIYMVYSKKQLEIENTFTMKYIELQKIYYEKAIENDENIRRFKHDIAKHIGVMEALCSNNEMQGLKEYVRDIGVKYVDAMTQIHTGNLVADYFINQTIAELKKQGAIEFEIIGQFPEKIIVSSSDLCILFGNIMENVLEALKKWRGIEN